MAKEITLKNVAEAIVLSDPDQIISICESFPLTFNRVAKNLHSSNFSVMEFFRSFGDRILASDVEDELMEVKSSPATPTKGKRGRPAKPKEVLEEEASPAPEKGKRGRPAKPKPEVEEEIIEEEIIEEEIIDDATQPDFDSMDLQTLWDALKKAGLQDHAKSRKSSDIRAACAMLWKSGKLKFEVDDSSDDGWDLD